MTLRERVYAWESLIKIFVLKNLIIWRDEKLFNNVASLFVDCYNNDLVMTLQIFYYGNGNTREKSIVTTGWKNYSKLKKNS